MTTVPLQADTAAAVRRYASIARASLDLDEAGPISYAGLWLLLARVAPVATNSVEFRNTLGLAPEVAADNATRLLAEPHPSVATALGAWLANDITLAGDLSVALESLPTQEDMDAWASEQTRGLIDTFPIELEPDTMLVLATALVLTPRWSRGICFDDETAMLLLTQGVQAVVETSVGPVAVAVPPTKDGIDVISVIAAPEVPATQVWDAVDEVAALLDSGELNNNTFPTDLPEDGVQQGHAWTSYLAERTFWGNAPADGSVVWETRLPEWTATTSHNLTKAPGVALVVESIQALLPEESEVKCVQGATATYDEEGFSAAAVTAMDFVATGMPEREDRRVRLVEVTFDRPHALVAIARGGAWDGIPLLHSWVTPEERTTDDER